MCTRLKTSAGLGLEGAYMTLTHINTKFFQTTYNGIYKKYVLTPDHIHTSAIVPIPGSNHTQKLYNAATSSNDENSGISAIPVRFNVMEG
ncbi:hypothetical protein BOTBODRAFT_180737 [Botryobasidium botryosum FD-172 SS1]|uniref:Uncharacterized protein n=1 Tax=Botryobasidium botryosum (strain FD-172 SS1) TaxID=930990 RepID=A0A067LVM3_BOTB1|nr:hypothetical protein BOTBODRAFT_180737 [Botryobasidium botryosum FD-172 SS1]